MKAHLWRGTWIDDQELEIRLNRLSSWTADCAGRALDIDMLLSAADVYAQQLKSKKGNYRELFADLRRQGRMPLKDIAPVIAEMAAFLERSHLEQKLQSELGSRSPFLPTRKRYEDSVFEAWAPLGLLVHIAPSNSPSVAPLSVIEGLLSGNVNFLKISGSDGMFPQFFLAGLLDCDVSGTLKQFVVSARFSSRNQDWLKRIFSLADGIAVWGGEEAAQSVRKLAPASARVIEWGHKISFIYLSKTAINDAAVLEQAAKECCQFEQQACSSPQCLYVEANDWTALQSFGRRFAKTLAKVSRTIPVVEPSAAEQAEITLATELLREQACLGQAEVIEDPSKKWRVLIDNRPALAASPLFRTIWIKPLPRQRIVATLRPMRQYLQTAGLACGLEDLAQLSELMIQAGAVRVRRVGEMPGSYEGEPHDGVYALQRYCRRVSIQTDDKAQGISNFADLRAVAAPRKKIKPRIMAKADFQAMTVDPRYAHLFFKSGGSSGKPKLSVFSYDDYHQQMRLGAEGLYAAGLDPLTDRSMNLFFSGGLYGGFLSIFSVLEGLRAVQFPMAAVMDFPAVADTIIKNRVNVLLGMPSYIIELFEKAGPALKKYRGINKVYYGGEHFNDAQRRWLKQRFGVALIKSVGYGSVDTGPLGYQCLHCEGSVHHLHQKLQSLEIVKLGADSPVASQEIGRLIFSSKVRKGQSLERYDLGDVGHWVLGRCPCGRAAPRFRLLGRSGDVVRAGSEFLNYQKFVSVLSERLDYAGPIQLLLSQEKFKDKLTVRLSGNGAVDADKARETLLSNYDDLFEAVSKEKMLILEVNKVSSDNFLRAKGSGKLARIVDTRKR